MMRLIVGLGNPGRDYQWTPHNVGFLAVDALAERTGIRVTRPEAKSLIGRGTLAGQEVIFAKPQTMMNLSGVAVRMLLERYEADPAEMIVLLDEVDLPWGMLRIRMGVQPKQMWGDRRDYVLSQMNREERQIAEEMAVHAAEAVEMIFTEGVEKAMSKFNRKAPREESAG